MGTADVGQGPTPELLALVHEKIHEAYYSARVLGLSHAQASANAAAALMPVFVSVDENAHARGRVEAEGEREASMEQQS